MRKAPQPLAIARPHSSTTGVPMFGRGGVQTDLPKDAKSVVGHRHLACHWTRGFGGHGSNAGRFRHEGVLGDGWQLGILVGRVHCELGDEHVGPGDITYDCRHGDGSGEYDEVPGFCRRVMTDEIASHQLLSMSGRYLGAEAVVDDGDAFDEKGIRLIATVGKRFAEGERLEGEIWKSLSRLGVGRGA